MSLDEIMAIVRDHFGDSYPISTGSATTSDPLVITEEVDYVAIEYAISGFMLRSIFRYNYRLKEQTSYQANGRSIDKLTFIATRQEAPEIEKLFYFAFDVTAGLQAMHEAL